MPSPPRCPNHRVCPIPPGDPIAGTRGGGAPSLAPIAADRGPDDPDSTDQPDDAPSADVAAVLAANQAYYDAFEAADMDRMSEAWEHNDSVVCTHPGWATLRGWSKVAASWFAIFRNPARLQFILTEPHAVVNGDVAWVTVNENLLGGGVSGTVAALNIYVRHDQAWLLVAHHGSSVAGS